MNKTNYNRFMPIKKEYRSNRSYLKLGALVCFLLLLFTLLIGCSQTPTNSQSSTEKNKPQSTATPTNTPDTTKSTDTTVPTNTAESTDTTAPAVTPKPVGTTNLNETFLMILEKRQSYYSVDSERYAILAENGPDLLQYSFIDMDSDGTNEFAVMCEDGTIKIFKKFSNLISGYSFVYRKMCKINQDGTFNWKERNGNYGCSKLQLSKYEYTTVDLWHVEYDESGSATYYVNNTPVSEQEFKNASNQTSNESIVWTSCTDTPLNPNDYATYVYFGNYLFPISYIKNGVQTVIGGTSVYKILDLIPSEYLLNEISVSPMFEDGNIPKIFQYDGVNNFSVNSIRTNADWDMFPTKVRYEKYTLNNQPNNAEWTEYFQNKLNEICPNIPLVFEEAYFLNCDENGTQTVIVNIGNTFNKQVVSELFEGYTIPDSPTPPPSSETVFYQMSAIFIYKDNEVYTYELLNHVCKSSEYSAPKYIPPQEEGQPYNLDYYSVQLNEQNQFIICPLYANHVTWESFNRFLSNNVYLICDIDGDGESEIVVSRFIKYPYVRIYKLNGQKIEDYATISTIG